MQSSYGTKIKTEHGCLTLRTSINEKGEVRQCSISITGQLANLPRPTLQLVMDSKTFNKAKYSELMLDAIAETYERRGDNNHANR